MKVYAIISEHGACSIREELEMICASREVAESYIDAKDSYWRNAHIEEMEIVDKMWGRPEGNELIWGRLILRMVGVHKFKKVAYFDNYNDANRAFYEWLEENK
jgi:hypothetical protein